MTASHLGQRIRHVREQLAAQLGWRNQTDFARALRITQGTVSDWERGPESKGTTPSTGDLWLVAHLCVEPDKVHHWLETGRDKPAIRPRNRSL